MVKRFLCCLLTLSILMSAVYASYADTAETDNLNFKYEVLRTLKIMPETSHENYDILRDISKKAFLAYVCNITGDYNFDEDDGDEAILIAENMGLIHKNQDDLYKLISYNEAMTILVRLLGYEDHAQAKGGYPYGYIDTAVSLGLAKGVSSGSGRTLKEHDIVNLLYNVIRTPYASLSSIGQYEIGSAHSYSDEKDILYTFRGIYRIDGIIEATEISSLRPDESVGMGMIRVGGYVYDTAEDYTDYLGLNTVAFVKEETDGYDTLVAAIPYDNEELILYSEDIYGPDEDFTALSYYNENNKTVKAQFEELAAVMYNGQPMGTYTKELFMPKDGFIRLINNNKRGGYDVISITSYDTVVVENVSSYSQSVTNVYKYAPVSKLVLEAKDKDFISIVYDGKKINAEELKKGDVLRIAKSVLNGKTIIKGFVSRRQITGSIYSVQYDEDIKVTVDGVEYVLSEVYESMLSHKPADPKALQLKTGSSYVFHLDDNGKIAYAEDIAGNVRYGIVFAAANEGSLASVSKVKIFTSEGEMKEYHLSEKVVFNNGMGTESRIKGSDVIGQLPQSRAGSLNLVEYILDSAGKVSHISLPEENADGNNGRFNKIEDFTDNYRTGNSSFDSEIFIRDDSIMWFVNAEALQEEDSYTIGARNLLQNDESCTLNAYNVNEGNFADMFILKRNTSSKTLSMQLGDLFMVDEISKAMNSEGEEVYIIEGKVGVYEAFSYYCADSSIAGKLKHGDVISIHTNSKGYVDDFEHYRSYEAGKTVYEDPADTNKQMHAVETVLQGVVLDSDTDEKWIKINTGTTTQRVVRTANVSSVIIYNTQNDEIYKGTINDVEVGNKIIAKLRWSNCTTLVIYR